jgi:hypothetical protein
MGLVVDLAAGAKESEWKVSSDQDEAHGLCVLDLARKTLVHLEPELDREIHEAEGLKGGFS